MFTQFSTTADSISKASTMVFRIGTDAHLYDDPDDANITSLLDSKYDSEKCEALKRILALIAQGFDVSNFFPQVVKNVASHSIEVKKLVYSYLLHYAEKRPNEALLSINYFQKDLGDPNPLVRAWALRTMAGIRLHDIAQIVLVAVNKCARDASVYVRKCAANALPKLQDLRLDDQATAIEEVVGILLNDHSPGVIGAAAAAFASVCPNNLSLIGKYYKKLCETLPDVEEWGQIILIGILLRYAIARHGLSKESIMYSSPRLDHGDSAKEGSDTCSEVKEDYNSCSTVKYDSEIANIIFRSYLEGPDKYLSRLQDSDKSSPAIDDSYFTSASSNADIKLLVQCTSPLLWSHNSAVVLAAAGIHWIMAPKEDLKRIVKPLLFLLRSSTPSKYVVLCNIQIFAKALPSLFIEYFEDFFISSLDPYQVKRLKLDILSSIATESSISSILQEFQDYVRDPDRMFAADTVSAIGSCAQRLPTISKTCLEGLLALTSPESLNSEAASMDEEAVVLIQVVNSIKDIIKQDPASHEKVIAHLIRSLDSIRVPAARAMVIWMVGEYNSVGEVMPKILPTVLQYLAWCFRSEVLEAKLQILNACVKVILHTGENASIFQKILGYVLDVAKCDLNYDVRDRARLLNHLMSSCYISSDNLKEVKFQDEICRASEMLVGHLLGGQFKPPSSQSSSYRYYLPGSLSQLVLHAAPGYEPLPEPRSLVFDEINSNVIQEDEAAHSDSYEEDDAESVSGSLDGESTTGYSSRDSETASTQGGDYGRRSNSEVDNNVDPLIRLSDLGNQTNHDEMSQKASGTNDFGVLMSKTALESWLDESSSVDQNSADTGYINRSSARISIGDIRGKVQPKSHALLNPANGNGLSVDYIFTSEVSDVSKVLVCIEVTFKNYSSELLSNILLVEEESSRSPESTDQVSMNASTSTTSSTDVPTLVPMEEIFELGPGHVTKRMLQVRFNHHLLPLKLVLLCNGKKYPVKLKPDIGYFVKPLPMDAEKFVQKESQLPGMFEYTRRCIFSDHVEGLSNNKDNTDNFLFICESLALKILSNSNVHLVSVDLPVAGSLEDASGLRLRFSGEVISNGLPCLITITLDGRCSEPLNASVKVNCEETVFGLNLLNRVVNFLPEPASQQV